MTLTIELDYYQIAIGMILALVVITLAIIIAILVLSILEIHENPFTPEISRLLIRNFTVA